MTTRKALIIGINYIGTPNALRGCCNDAMNLKNFLKTECSYSDNQIMLMTDFSEDPKKLPTRENILFQMRELVKDCTPQSKLFYSSSSHGSQVRDTNGDEPDGLDESIYTLDGKMIIDDEIRAIFVPALKVGAQLFCIFDSCHSSSIIDLRYSFNINITPTSETYAMELSRQYKDSDGQIICVSGCLDNQTSADTFEAGKNCGALTWGLLETMKKLKVKGKLPTYRSFIKNLTTLLKQKGYTQTPKLSCGRPLDLNSNIVL